MTPTELIERARSQAEVCVDRLVSIYGPEVSSLLRTGRPLPLLGLLAHPDQHKEMRTFRYGHVLGAPLSSGALAAWQERHPQIQVAPDMTALLLAVDGIHLWADLDTGRAYFGILPLAEWRGVREVLGGEDVPEETLVISYHDNGDAFLLLGPDGKFTWFDPQSPDDSTHLGGSVGGLLEWWWHNCEQLDPRRRGSGSR